MALTPGTRLGVYEITAQLGAGGMGEVYRARDSKLGRDVAIKVLPAALAGDADYLARFQREAQVLAALNHPNIAAIYGLEESAIVMELVEGGTLRGPVPLTEALAIARQIAEALEAAHEKGIVHRDLKPGNVKITPEGVVKVLDFGLAKAAESTSQAVAANSPTLTMRATQAGIILGTAGYMAPEQGAGKPVDKRADIWSFGVVLWELLTGGSMFAGETVSHTLAHVLTREIKLDGVPVSVRPLLSRCLDRNVKTRLRDIGEARVAIDQILAGAHEPAPAAPAAPTRRSWLPWAAAVPIAAIALGAGWYLRPQPKPEAVEFEMTPQQGVLFYRPVISPDGRKIVFDAYVHGARKLLLRNLDRAETRTLGEGENIIGQPFWAPDSRKFAIFSGNKLVAIDLENSRRVLCDTISTEGAWGSSGEILISTESGIAHVPETGGVPRPALSLDAGRGESRQRHPAFLPGGKRFLYVSVAAREPGIYVASLDGAKPAFVAPGIAATVQYTPGFLVYLKDTQLFASPFDLSGTRITGEEIRLPATPLNWSVSMNGHLVYQPSLIGEARMTWVSRDGKPLATPGEMSDYSEFRLSPDASRAAFVRSSQPNIWTMDLERGNISRLTFTGTVRTPVWSPDGSQIAYTTVQGPPYRIYRRAADGTGAEETLLEFNEQVRTVSWSPNGKFILFVAGLRGRWDHYLLPVSGERKPIPYLLDNYDKYEGDFSPDGRWIAYSSNESGRREVYIRPVPETAGGMPGVQGKWQVSTNGGLHMRWRNDGKELVYSEPAGRLMSVAVEASGKALRLSTPQQLAVQVVAAVGPLYTYDMAPDGKRFLLLDRNQTPGNPIVVVLNWAARLPKR